MVPGFVRGNRKKPGAKTPVGIKTFRRKVNLEKGLLKKVFRCRPTADKPHQKVKKLLPITLHQDLKGLVLATAIEPKKLLIGRQTARLCVF